MEGSNFIIPDAWKLLLLGFICLCVFARRQVGIGTLRRPLGYVGQVGIEYYPHTSIPVATPSEANPTYAFPT